MQKVRPPIHQTPAAVFLLRKMIPLKYNNYKIAHVMLRHVPLRNLSACMSCHSQKLAGVVDHLLTLLLAEARAENLREALLCFRVKAGKFNLTLFHRGLAIQVFIHSFW